MLIAIYDPARYWTERLLPTIDRVLNDLQQHITVQTISTVEAFETETLPELVFIPLDYPEAAVALRRKTIDSEIIFIGQTEQLTRNLLGYRPIGCLQRIADAETLLKRFLFYLQHINRQYTIQTRDRSVAIPHADIRYFQSSGHRVLIFTDTLNDPIAHLRKLDEIEQELAPLPYLRCHQRYLVHLQFVSRLDHQTMRLIMDNGEELPVSKRYFGHVIDAMLAYSRG